MHTIEDLKSRGLKMRIGAFEGKDAKNNRLILEVLATNEPLIKWGILKEAKKQTGISWPTVSRRVDDLKERGYIEVTGKKKTRVGKRTLFTPEYWLTMKGLIAALYIENVRRNPSKVLQKLFSSWTLWIKEFKEEEINEFVVKNIYKILEEISVIPIDLESSSKSEVMIIIESLLDVFYLFPSKWWRKLERNPDFVRNIYEGFLLGERKLREEKATIEEKLERIEAQKQRLETLMKKTAKKSGRGDGDG